jgi:threonylcarbamoyladenosine tRNA methylthiotransferase MtaB
MPRVAFSTLGCKVNQFETETIEGLFKQRGYAVVSFDQAADVYVINTCSVTHLGERKSRQLIRRASRINPDATIVVTGCYAQVSPDEVEALGEVDVIVGTQQRHRIVDLAEEAIRKNSKITAVGDIMTASHFEDIPLFSMPGRTRAFLKIQEGCANYCTYCIIPYARGPLRSRPLTSIMEETRKLVAAGFQEIVLTGIHLGAYGRDLPQDSNLAQAIRAVLSVEGVRRLRLGSLESIEVSDEIIEIMQSDDRLCPHLHLPLQAGDDQILQAMNRHYTVAEYRRFIADIQRHIPDVAISTDIIVGFPGETAAMFQNTLDSVDTIDFARIHVFPYSRRSGTPAATYPDQVAEVEKKRRVKMLTVLAKEKAAAFEKRFIGRNLAVLFESGQDDTVEGLTGNYIRVYAKGKQKFLGEIVNVTATKLYKDGLWGEILD